jgi:hypothetical protein
MAGTIPNTMPSVAASNDYITAQPEQMPISSGGILETTVETVQARTARSEPMSLLKKQGDGFDHELREIAERAARLAGQSRGRLPRRTPA